ncbi:hypothetical protein ABPG75_010058 [Micractinium tetrahymenae]
MVPQPHAVERQAAVLLSIGQVVLWMRMPASSWADHAHQALATVAAAAIAAAAFLQPAGYARLRLWLIPVCRIGLHLMPSQRSAATGSSGLLMSRAPQPGLAGAAMDAVRLGLGLRLLPNSLISLLFRLPLLLGIATHTAVVLLTRNNEEYCQSQLLSHPVAQERIVALWTAMDVSSLAISPLAPVLHAGATAGAAGHATAQQAW